MEDQFRAWWQESYGWHVGAHAVMTHVAWGEHLLATRPKPPSLKARLTEAIQNEDLDTALKLVEGLDDSL